MSSRKQLLSFTSSFLTLRRTIKRYDNSMRKYLDDDRNPYLKSQIEGIQMKRSRKSVFDKLVDKRTTGFTQYFPKAGEPSILKKPHVSYDHIGQKRALYLSKVLRTFLADRIGTGEIGGILAGKQFHLTNIIIPVDLNRIEIHWWSPENETQVIEDCLKNAGEDLKNALRLSRLLPNLPPVLFKRDDLRSNVEEIHELLNNADMGPKETEKINDGLLPVSDSIHERRDLYDSDRTVLLQKLSKTSSDISLTNADDDDNDDNKDIKKSVTIDDVQRHMKAFALTKKMKKEQESRSAMYGIMELEHERKLAKEEHFRLTECREDTTPTLK